MARTTRKPCAIKRGWQRGDPLRGVDRSDICGACVTASVCFFDGIRTRNNFFSLGLSFFIFRKVRDRGTEASLRVIHRCDIWMTRCQTGLKQAEQEARGLHPLSLLLIAHSKKTKSPTENKARPEHGPRKLFRRAEERSHGHSLVLRGSRPC